MEDVCDTVEFKMGVGKFEFYLCSLGDVTVPCLVLIYFISVCLKCLTAQVLCKRNVALFSFLREMYIDLMV